MLLRHSYFEGKNNYSYPSISASITLNNEHTCFKGMASEIKGQLLKLENLSVELGGKKILQNINLNIREGEMLGIVGVSGAGKTTLLNAIIGYYPITSGRVMYGSKIAGKFVPGMENPESYKRLFGFSTQDPSFYPELTVSENLNYFAGLYNLGKSIKEQNIKKALELVELHDFVSMPGKNLSGGMKKRLDLAISLIHDPEILILDEPTSGLDPILTHEIYELLRLIRDVDKTIIIASHNYDMLERYADRIAILSESRIIDCDKPAELIRKYKAKDLIEVFRKIGVISV